MTSLRRRRLKEMGARKNPVLKANMWGERECLPKKPMKIVSHPLSNYLAAAVWFVKNFDLKINDPDQPGTNKRCQSMLYFYILSLNICYKDQLRDLIIEQWSNKPMTNTQH